MLAAGADLLDIGGESTRPGSPAVPLALELARVLPVVREAVRFNVPVSVDTYKPEVMAAVLELAPLAVRESPKQRHAATGSGPLDWTGGA